MPRMCQECGSELVIPKKAPVPAKRFCSPKCRMEFNNRRRDRGAELYDLMMIMRFERDVGKDEKIWSLICNQASAYRDADKSKRQGRKSWQSFDEAVRLIPLYRTPEAGDSR